MNFLISKFIFVSRAYESCTHKKETDLWNLIESEINRDTNDEVQNCFDTLDNDLRDRGYEISGGAHEYFVDLLPGVVKINLNRKMDISRGDSLRSFENFGSEILSPAYELVQVTNDIINGETINCKFDHYYYMRLNPEYHIKKINFEFMCRCQIGDGDATFCSNLPINITIIINSISLLNLVFSMADLISVDFEEKQKFHKIRHLQ